MSKRRFLLLAGPPTVAAVSLFAAVAGEVPRVWTSIDGRSVSGHLAGLERGHPVVFDETGRRLRLPLEQLSEADREWLAQWRSDRSPTEAQAPLDPAARGARVVQPPVTLRRVSDEGGSVHRYASPVYDFEIDAELPMAVLGELARMAEATVRLVDSMPLSLPPRGERRYLARLYGSRSDFEAAGGSPGLAGWFQAGGWGRAGALIMPIESLGIADMSRGAGIPDGHVLRHEIAHQATADVMPLLPLWLREGIAEVVARTPYRDGVFEPGERGLVVALKRRHEEMRRIGTETDAFGGTGPVRTQISLPALMERERSSWSGLDIAEQHRCYFTAHLLTAWYLHLDGDGEARALRALFDEASEASLYLMTCGEEGRWPEEAGTPDWRSGPAAVVRAGEALLQGGRSWQEIDAAYLADLQSKWGLRLADER